MLARHYARPHRFVCVTDDGAGLVDDVEVVPAWNDFADVNSPHGAHASSCYRRLRMFDPDIGKYFGERFASLDLDLVITRDVVPVFDRSEPLVLLRDPYKPTQYNGSLVLMTAGARPDLWEGFAPNRSPQIARGAGFMGSDQAWLSWRVVGAPAWDTRDGIYSYGKDIAQTGTLPDDARIVSFHGRVDPWHQEAQRLGWVREHWNGHEKKGSA